jgi:hypothetical protein
MEFLDLSALRQTDQFGQILRREISRPSQKPRAFVVRVDQ